MILFTLTATLRTPLIMRGPMTLDALLMAVLERGDVSDLIQCVDGLYYASGAQLVDPLPAIRASFVASMRPERTPEWVDVILPNAKKKTDIAIGAQRRREAGNVLSGYQALPARAVEWHATGDADAVLEALCEVPFIGKRRAAGYGEVIAWSVEAGDLDGLVGYEGEPLRPVPVERWVDGGDWPRVEAAWRPPYWSIENRAECVVNFGVV
jgi:hypothetical protein